MPFIAIREILDMVVMTVAVGYIFSGAFSAMRHGRTEQKAYDPIAAYQQMRIGISWEEMKFSMLVVAPGLILHELGHKFVALAFGLFAQFHAAYFWLGFGALLKFMGSRFLFFVPAYVSHGGGTVVQSMLISLAGPLMNGLLWLIPTLLIRYKQVPQRWLPVAFLTAKVNMFLCIFNLLPIPGFDGFQFFRALWYAFGG